MGSNALYCFVSRFCNRCVACNGNTVIARILLAYSVVKHQLNELPCAVLVLGLGGYCDLGACADNGACSVCSARTGEAYKADVLAEVCVSGVGVDAEIVEIYAVKQRSVLTAGGLLLHPVVGVIVVESVIIYLSGIFLCSLQDCLELGRIKVAGCVCIVNEVGECNGSAEKVRSSHCLAVVCKGCALGHGSKYLVCLIHGK